MHCGRPGVVRGVNEQRLLRVPVRLGARVSIDVCAGEFVSTGTVLGGLHGVSDTADRRRARELRRVASCVRVGRSRTIDQDPGYGLRLLVDVAIRALSPAVNDPTTAIQVLDHLHDALIRLSGRPLGRALVLDSLGVPRLLRPAPEWLELVSLALDEILHDGARSGVPSSTSTANSWQRPISR